MATSREMGTPTVEAPPRVELVEKPKDGETKSYEQIGQERMQKAKDLISGGFTSLQEKAGGFMGGLKKMAEKAVGFALTLPDRIIDVGKAVGRGAKDVTFAVGRGIERGANIVVGGVEAGVGTVVKGAETVAGAARTGKEFVKNKAIDAVVAAKNGYERVVGKGRELADRSRNKINGAVDSFNRWRNERRLEQVRIAEQRRKEQENLRKEINRDRAANLLEMDRPKLDRLLLLADSI